MADNVIRYRASLQDDVSGGLKRIKAEAQASGSGIGSAFGKAAGDLEKGVGRVGGAISHAGSQIKGLATGPLAAIGLGLGAAGLAGWLTDAVQKTDDFGRSVNAMAALTGMGAEKTSALVAVLEKFGVAADDSQKALGFLMKNVGIMAAGGNAATVSTTDLKIATDKVTIAQENLAKVEANRKHTSQQLLAAQDGVASAQQHLTDLQDKASNSLGKLSAFEKQYGIQLTDANGHIKDANELVLTAADYFNSNAAATEKAAAMSKLFGRGWQSLIPVLQLGRQGILDAEQAAQELGVTLTDQNVKQLADYRKSTRELGEAMQALQLAVGMELIPTFKDVAEAATKWLEKGGIQQIKGAVATGVEFAHEFAGAFKTYVIPIFSALTGLWKQVPDPVKQLLIAGFIGQRTLKWTFGIDILQPVEKGITGALGGLVGKLTGGLFQRGGTPANPLFVADVGKGAANVIKDVLPGAAEAGGAAAGGEAAAGGAVEAVGLGAVGSVAIVGTALAALVGLYALGEKNQGAGGANVNVNNMSGNAMAGFTNVTGAIDTNTAESVTATRDMDKNLSSAAELGIGATRDMDKNLGSTKDALVVALDAMKGRLTQGQKDQINHAANDAKNLINQMIAGNRKLDPLAAIRASTDLVKVYTSGTAKNTSNALANEAKLRALAEKFDQQGDHATAAKIRAELKVLETTVAAWGKAEVTQLARLGSSSVQNRPNAGGSGARGHASGVIGKTTAETNIGDLGIMGEAGSETFAILANPRPIPKTGGAIGGGDSTLVVQVMPGHGLITPSMGRALAAELGPHILVWLQRQGILPRIGTPQRG